MDYLEAIRREGEAFYATADKADPSFGVPNCPDWNIGDLVWHLGGVHWFWGTVIETRATEPDGIEDGLPPRPTDYPEVVAWGRSQADRMISILEANDDATPVWTWAPTQNVGFIRRHQVQEAAVHRWDMQNAARSDPPTPIEPDAAADSIDEFLAVQLPFAVNHEEPLPGTVHVHCTDTAGEWFIHPDGRVEPIHAKGDVAIRGTASDLLLALYKRVDINALDVIGDAAIAQKMRNALDTE